MNDIDELLKLLSLYGGEIVSTASLSTEDINQARESGRMYVDENSFGYVWDPDIKKFPETEEEIAFFERWFPLAIKLPEGLYERLMAAIDKENENHVPYIHCDKCNAQTEYYTEVDGHKLCMKCNEELVEA